MARASVAVVGSGTVGPLPTSCGPPPMTSLTRKARVCVGAAARVKPPPLMRERWRRTVLISRVDAPDERSAETTSRLSTRLSPSQGAQRTEDAPPETSAVSNPCAPRASSSARSAAMTLRSSGKGCAARMSSRRTSRMSHGVSSGVTTRTRSRNGLQRSSAPLAIAGADLPTARIEALRARIGLGGSASCTRVAMSIDVRAPRNASIKRVRRLIGPHCRPRQSRAPRRIGAMRR
jgi:hypothetical protein